MPTSSTERQSASYPLTRLQQGMLFNSISAPGSGVEIQHLLTRSRDVLHPEAMRQAWDQTIRRHPALRTRFDWKSGAEARQIVEANVDVEPVVHPWNRFSPEECETKIWTVTEDDRFIDLNLATAPIQRVQLYDMGKRGFHCLWTFHHALLDGRSYTLTLQEVFDRYDAIVAGDVYKAEPVRPYGDYVEWLSALDLTSTEEYWRNLLGSFTAPTPVGVPWNVETDPSARGCGEREIRLTAGVTARLRELAGAIEVTVNTLVQGAWALLLHRHSGEPEVVFGATRASRNSGLPGMEAMVGLFISTLPMRVEVDSGERVEAWLKKIRAQHVAHRPYEQASVSDLQRWSGVPGGSSLFDSIIVFENQHPERRLRALGGKWSRRSVYYRGQTSYPLTLYGFADDELLLKIEYFRDVYDDASVERMLGQMAIILEDFVDAPTSVLGDVNCLPDAERTRVLVEWNDTREDYPRSSSLQHCFEAQVEETPHNVAVSSGGVRRTYRELNERANQLARFLRRRGVGPGTLVGICVDRSVDVPVALLGILKAGAGYVPMDPTYPAQRLSYMLQKARCPVVVTESDLVVEGLESIDVAIVLLDVDWSAIAAESAENLQTDMSPEDLAYVIFTSGSTGNPKGVQVPHRAVVNFLTTMARRPCLNTGDRLLAVTTLSFDIHVLEIFGPLLVGGEVVIATRVESADGSHLLRLIQEHDVNVMQATPATWRLLIGAGWNGAEGFRLLVGGEPLPGDLLEQMLQRVPSVWNMYGPTETTVWSTCREIRSADLPVCIGRPIANTRCYVFDSRMHPVPVGAPGELFIGGDGVARGYLGQPDLTAERFIRNPIDSADGELIYRTGDLVRFHPNGDLEYINRIDNQVKVRGYRIELGEIEVVLSQHPAVAQVAAHVREDNPGDRRLVAYHVPAGDSNADDDELRRHLRTRVPEYMVPQHFVRLDSLPLTPNGKIDRKALPKPEIDTAGRESAWVGPRTELERLLTEIWELMLEVRPGLSDNFFELGGDSLLALRLVIETERVTGRKLSLSTLFQGPTIEQIAENLGREDDPDYSLVLLNDTQHGTPLFCISGIYLYQPLAKALGDSFPVFGVYLKGETDLYMDSPSGSMSHISTEELAARYIEAIRTRQPAGPYRLAGVSYGGIVAYEMARQLVDDDETVEIVGLFDCVLRSALSRNWRKWVQTHFKRAMREGPIRYLSQRLDRRWQLLRHRLRLHGIASATSRSEPTVDHLQELRNEALFRRVLSYEPKEYSGKVVVFRAMDRTQFQACDVAPELGWAGRATGGIDVHDVLGGHPSMLKEPYVLELARKFAPYLEYRPGDASVGSRLRPR